MGSSAIIPSARPSASSFTVPPVLLVLFSGPVVLPVVHRLRATGHRDNDFVQRCIGAFSVVCLNGAARRQPAPAVPTASESAVAACLLRPARPRRTRDRPARLRPDDPDRRARVGLVYALWYAAMAADSVLAGEIGSLLQQKT